ncbi:hypothetical protein yberc0001_10650 [Yersinia bercovieri ATCC 43970]|uniref:Uncharacterized protein n=1 Tax=Yersinia bercovieri ATCC 43970 TaxID=349968 RepID=A0ABP2E7D1_YERBE|nr:hypothetical protein yberc0001_10650 [Yersinia bercovieri ATCC 43970]
MGSRYTIAAHSVSPIPRSQYSLSPRIQAHYLRSVFLITQPDEAESRHSNESRKIN